MLYLPAPRCWAGVKEALVRRASAGTSRFAVATAVSAAAEHVRDATQASVNVL